MRSADPGTQTRRRYAPWLVAIVTAALVAYGIFVAAADANAVFEIWTGASLRGVGIALSLATLGFALRSFRWHSLLTTGGGRPRLGVSFMTYFLGLGMGVTPGKAAELVKVYAVRRLAAVPTTLGIAAYGVEKLGDALGVIVLLLLSSAPLWLKVGAAALVVLLVALAQLAARPAARAPNSGSAAPPRWRIAMRRFFETVRPLLLLRPFAFATLVGTAVWILETTAMMVLAAALGLDVPWSLCALAYAAGSIAGFLSLVPGGLGVAEAGIAGVLLANGVPAAEAVALTIGIRTVTLWWGVFLGALAFLAYAPWRSLSQRQSPSQIPEVPSGVAAETD